mgnify:CR=1 FL=1
MMRSKGWDAVIVTGNDPHNSEYSAARWHQVAWLSGYTGEGDLVIVISQSGETLDTMAALREAKKRGGHNLSSPNRVGGRGGAAQDPRAGSSPYPRVARRAFLGL